MTNPSGQTPDEPNLDDVMTPTEHPVPDRHAHGKMPKHPDDDALEERTEHEREEVGLDENG